MQLSLQGFKLGNTYLSINHPSNVVLTNWKCLEFQSALPLLCHCLFQTLSFFSFIKLNSVSHVLDKVFSLWDCRHLASNYSFTPSQPHRCHSEPVAFGHSLASACGL